MKLATNPVSGVQGRALIIAQPAGFPMCCWMGNASLSAQMDTLTRKAVVQNATPPVGSAMAHRNMIASPVTLMSLLLVGTAGPAVKKSSSSTLWGTVLTAILCASTVQLISTTLGVSA